MVKATTKNDIFPDDEGDEAQTEVAGLATDWDGSVSLTLKSNGGYDQPWLVFRAPSAAALVDKLSDEDSVNALIARAAEVDAAFKAAVKTPERAAAPSKGSSEGGKPAAATDLPDGVDVAYCAHGAMEFKTGVGKNNKVWKGQFCTQKGSDCEVKWIR